MKKQHVMKALAGAALAGLSVVSAACGPSEAEPTDLPTVEQTDVTPNQGAPATTPDRTGDQSVKDQPTQTFVPTASTEAEPSGRTVSINGVVLGDDDLASMESALGLQVMDGDYWYDIYSGAFGYLGGPTAGFILPGLPVGGELEADASDGMTGVFLNGRELPEIDVFALEQLLGAIPSGYYWLDGQGFYGEEGGPAVGNLIWAAGTATAGSGGGGGSGGYFDQNYGGYIGGDGQSSYYFDPSTGCSVMSGEGVSC